MRPTGYTIEWFADMWRLRFKGELVADFDDFNEAKLYSHAHEKTLAAAKYLKRFGDGFKTYCPNCAEVREVWRIETLSGDRIAGCVVCKRFIALKNSLGVRNVSESHH